MNSRVTYALVGVALALTILAVFWQVTSHEFINLDDDEYVTENSNVLAGLTKAGVVWAFNAGYSSNWHPLTWLSHMLDCRIWGKDPKGHHLASLLLHIGNTLLLLLLLTRMTGAFWKSAFVAALFGLHPLHVESVAWVAERKDVLSTFFWMLTMLAYVSYVRRPGIGRYLLVALLFALGLMAKPMLVTLPLVLLVMDYWPLGRMTVKPTGRKAKPIKGPGWKLLWEKVPLLALSAESCVLTYVAQSKGGAVRTLEQYPLWIRAGNAAIAYVEYVAKTLWPRNLAVSYPHPGRNLPIWGAVGAALLIVLASVLVRRSATRRPYLAAGWLWYMVTLVPVIGLVQVGAHAMADRYTYVPLIGLFIVFAWGVPDLVCRWTGRDSRRLAIPAVAALAALSACTWVQLGYWKDSMTLFDHAVSVTRGNYLAHNNLGVALAAKGRLDDAKREYEESLRINPRHARAHNNLGGVFAERGRLAEAIAHFTEAIRLDSGYENAYNNMAAALTRLGRVDEAISYYYEALRINPDYSDAHYNLGIALASQGKTEEAIAQYSQALRLRPDNPNIHNNLGIALAAQGKRKEAIAHYQEALRADPRFVEAHVNLGLALADERNYDEAIAHYNQAIKIKPRLGVPHFDLAVAYYYTKDYPAAWRQIRICRDLGLTPNSDFVRALSLKMREPKE